MSLLKADYRHHAFYCSDTSSKQGCTKPYVRLLHHFFVFKVNKNILKYRIKSGFSQADKNVPVPVIL